jgi:hypothetical protein
MKKPLLNGQSDKELWLLSDGIRNLMRSDQAEIVSEIADYVISQYRVLQISTEFIEKRKGTAIPGFIALLSAVTRFLEVVEDQSGEKIVCVARYDNERKAIDKIRQRLPQIGWSELKFRRRPTFSGLSALFKELLPLWRRLFRISRRLHRQHKYFRVFRVIELITYYVRYLKIFEKSDFELAITSNHSNPHGIAFNLAARKCGITVVLVTHGMPIRPVARLSYDLAIVHCEIARRIYLDEGCKLGRVLIHGRKQDYAPMPLSLPERLKIGIFLCKDVNEKGLQELTERLLKNPRVSRVLIRPHPKNLWREIETWIDAVNNPQLQKSESGTVAGDFESLDIVFAGNSSVLVEAVTAGKPGIYVKNLDCGPFDLHRFVERKLIYPMDDQLNFNFDDILKFYLRPDWLDVLRLFANIDEDETQVEAQIEIMLREILAGK